MSIKATILVAMDQNRAIGRNNQLLCDLPKDLKAFKEMTINQVVIMGRKTQESLPNGYLDERHNIVVTRHENLDDDRLYKPCFALMLLFKIVITLPRGYSSLADSKSTKRLLSKI